MTQLTSQLSLLDTAKEGNIGKRQQQVLDLFGMPANNPWKMFYNNRQIAEALNLPINSVTPRVKELREMGKLVEYKKMKDTVSNRLSIYWRLA